MLCAYWRSMCGEATSYLTRTTDDEGDNLCHSSPRCAAAAAMAEENCSRKEQDKNTEMYYILGS